MPVLSITPAARWYLAGLLGLALCLNYVDRGAVPTAAHLIQDELHLDERQLGWLFSGFFWTYALAQIPVGWLAERWGAHRVLACGIAIWAGATLLIGFAHSFAALLTLRLLLGLGESASFPCASKLLAASVPTSRLGLANGVLALGYLLGPAVGSYCGGLIMDSHGWRASFWVFGGLTLAWLLPWAQVGSLPVVRQEKDSAGPTWGELLRQRSLWGTSLGLFSSNYALYFMLTWLPFYLVRERGFSTLEMASLTGSAYVINAVSAFLAGWVIDRHISRGGSAGLAYKGAMVAAHGGWVLCMVAMGFGSRAWALAGMYAFQVLCGISSPGLYAIPQILGGPAASGRWVGVQNSLGNFAGMVAPALTGILAAGHHFGAAFLVTAAVSLLGLAGWVGMVPPLAPLRFLTSAPPPSSVADRS